MIVITYRERSIRNIPVLLFQKFRQVSFLVQRVLHSQRSFSRSSVQEPESERVQLKSWVRLRDWRAEMPLIVPKRVCLGVAPPRLMKHGIKSDVRKRRQQFMKRFPGSINFLKTAPGPMPIVICGSLTKSSASYPFRLQWLCR